MNAKVKVFFHRLARITTGVLALAVLCGYGSPQNRFVEIPQIKFTTQDVFDKEVQETAVRLAIPQGWRIKDPNVVVWWSATYTDPARIAVTWQGPADEAEVSMISKMSYAWDYGTPRLIQMMLGMVQQKRAELERMMRQYGVPAPPMQNMNIPEYKDGIVDNGILIGEPKNALNFIYWLLSQNKDITDIQLRKSERPQKIVDEYTKALPEINAQFATMAANSGLGRPTISFDVAEAEYTFRNVQTGKRYEGIAGVTIVYIVMPSAANQMTGARDNLVMWIACPIYAMGALEGRLQAHKEEFAAAIQNTQINPVWTNKVNYIASEVSRKISAQKQQMQLSEMEHQQRLWNSMKETQDYVHKTRQEVFQRKADALSNVSSGWTKAITGVQTWEANGRKYDISNNYDHVWVSRDGKVAGTNDSTYNPNHDSNVSGDWMRAEKRPW